MQDRESILTLDLVGSTIPALFWALDNLSFGLYQLAISTIWAQRLFLCQFPLAGKTPSGIIIAIPSPLPCQVPHVLSIFYFELVIKGLTQLIQMHLPKAIMYLLTDCDISLSK